MKKKLFNISLVVLVGVGAGTVVLNQKDSSTEQQMKLVQAESNAREQTNLPRCLNVQTQNEPKDETDARAISEIVGAKLTARPKTTAYGMYFKSFNITSSTDTIIYDGSSGNTFNFAVSRISEAAKWKLIKFEACK
jgi:hypothetical protein